MKEKDYELKICNIIDNLEAQMRYQCDKIHEQAYEQGHKQGYAEGYEIGKQDGYEDGQADTPFTDTEEAEKKAYNRGLDETWEAVRKIIEDVVDGGYSSDVLREIFGVSTVQSIFKLNTASETIAKIKEYEDKQKQDAEIKVGDEVYSDAFDDKGIVTHITADKVACVCIICNGSTMMKVGVNGLHKTGRHFPQIAEVLAELRGAENDE